MQNRFQELLELNSPLSSEIEFLEKTKVISEQYYSQKLLPALLQGAREHVAQRTRAVIKRANLVKNSHSVLSLVVEALSDPHFRKQQKYGPSREVIAKKVAAALKKREPLYLVGLMFTRKNVCPLKRGPGNESVMDFAEILSFVHLNSFASLISEFYPYGVKFKVLSEGRRFLRAFDLCEPYVRVYQQRIKEMIAKLKLDKMELIDHEDFLHKHLSWLEVKRRESEYAKAITLYRNTMLPIFDPLNFRNSLKLAIEKDPVTDLRNERNNFVPLWDSIKNSIPYIEISHLANTRGEEYQTTYRYIFRDLFTIRRDSTEELVRRSVLSRSWYAAIEHNARIMGDKNAGIVQENYFSQNAFRTSINPKTGLQLGIYTLRETTSRVQPWHGTALLEADTSGRITGTALSRLELESRGYLPVAVGEKNNYCFYATPRVLEILTAGKEPVFNLHTRDIKIPI